MLSYHGDIREDKGFIVVIPVEMNIPKRKSVDRWWNP
jgi:hypothetical protein